MNSSYVYIYDDFLAQRQFEREVAALETELNAFDMAGPIGRLALFRSARDLVMSLMDDQVTTVVVVGNDSTLDKTMWFLPDLDVTIGYIPLAKPCPVAELLGIPLGARACEVLAARYVETLDMGRLDDRYFFTEVLIPETRAGVDIDGRYTISSRDGGMLSVRNLGGMMKSRMEAAQASDGFLEAVLIPRVSEPKGLFRRRGKADGETTRVPFASGKIVSSDPVEAYVDNHVVNGFSFEVSVVPGALKMITGRGRKRDFAEPLRNIKRDGTVRPARARVPRGRDRSKNE